MKRRLGLELVKIKTVYGGDGVVVETWSIRNGGYCCSFSGSHTRTARRLGFGGHSESGSIRVFGYGKTLRGAIGVARRKYNRELAEFFRC